MLNKLIKKFFISYNDRVLRRLNKLVKKINTLELDIEKLSDQQLANKTIEFRNFIKKDKNINILLPEAFAVVRETSKRVFNMRHFDVQLMGGIVLHDCCIAEMRTGEGKTLTSTLPAYLNALSGKGVHIVTVNEYLAKRDAENNRPLFEFLNLTVGVNLSNLSLEDKRTAYNADITYSTSNEYGFDYLRDNMAFSIEERVQRKLHYALIDEIDSVLIDEARTPLIISGPAENSSKLYNEINKLVPNFISQDKEDSDKFHGKGHFYVDEKSRQINLTERGLILIEELMRKTNFMKKGESPYSTNNIILTHHVIAALRAHILFNRNIDYIVKNGKIIIVDEHTGRTMPGRRWSDGLHQAIEAKENLLVNDENHTLASITFQNYFRLYKKLAGMTGTANTEAFEFNSIYKLDTIVIPTNNPMIRKDLPDLVYMTENEKIAAVIKDIINCKKCNQPVLVGTSSIEKSELISYALNQVNIKHKVLNAKYHSIEADIIAQAGRPGAITIATNMAGRGTNIILGGNWEVEISKLNKPTSQQINNIKNSWEKLHNIVISAGGLHIIGTERHESRRIDNQLRGRSGRQGEIGSSRFYLSMEDNLIRIFTSDRVVHMMRKLGIKSGEAIEHPWISKAIFHAQQKVESRNFDIRKQLLEYDDVASDQRLAIYSQRNQILDTHDISKTIKSFREDVFQFLFNNYIPLNLLDDNWEIYKLKKCLKDDFKLDILITKDLIHQKILDGEKPYKFILKYAIQNYKNKEIIISTNIMRSLEKKIVIQTIDLLWKEHLAAMDYLRQGIHLRGYAQKDPKQEYKRESFILFAKMLELLKYEVISKLNIAQFYIIENNKNIQESINNQVYQKNFLLKTQIQQGVKISRNNYCPCKSGKKFKQCHGKI